MATDTHNLSLASLEGDIEQFVTWLEDDVPMDVRRETLARFRSELMAHASAGRAINPDSWSYLIALERVCGGE